MKCAGDNGDCPNDAKRGGYCWGHVKRRQRQRPLDTLKEPKGAARDRAGLPRRSATAWLQDAAADLSDADSLGDKQAYKLALARLRMGGKPRNLRRRPRKRKS